MGDMAEDFKAMKSLKQRKKDERMEEAAFKLGEAGIDYDKGSEWHWIIDGKIDFWPSTGLWKVRGSQGEGYGVDDLILECDRETIKPQDWAG